MGTAKCELFLRSRQSGKSPRRSAWIDSGKIDGPVLDVWAVCVPSDAGFMQISRRRPPRAMHHVPDVRD
jgi:hypothetical protein